MLDTGNGHAVNLKKSSPLSNANPAYAKEGSKTGQYQNPGLFLNTPDSLIFTPLNVHAHAHVLAILLPYPALTNQLGAPLVKAFNFYLQLY